MRHPVESLIRHCVYVGEKPDQADIDALQLAPEHQRAVGDAVDEGLRLRDTDARGAANEHALGASRSLIAELPDEQQDAGYVRVRDPLADVTNPDDLAAAIPRMY
jgi:hypothetical protein